MTRVMTKVFTKVQEKIAEKVAEKVGEKVVEKVAVKAAEFMAMLEIPGIGWAMDILEAFNLFVTAVDFQGWNLSVDYETIEAIRDDILVSYRETIFKSGGVTDATYPPMFNIFVDGTPYNLQISSKYKKNTDFLTKIQTDLYCTYFNEIVDYVSKVDKDIYKKIEEFVTGGINNDDLSQSTTGKDLSDADWTKFGDYSIAWSETSAGAVLRDKFIYKKI